MTILLVIMSLLLHVGFQPAARAATTISVNFALPEGFERTEIRDWIADLNGANELLSDSIKEELLRNGRTIPVGFFDNWVDFDGTIAMNGSTLTLTVESDEPLPEPDNPEPPPRLSPWMALLITLASAGVYFILRVTCSLFFLPESGPLAPLANAACSGLATFFATFARGAVIQHFYPDPNPDAWWNLLIFSFVLGASAALWDGFFGPKFNADSQNMFTSAARNMRNFGAKVKTWWFGGNIGAGIEAAGATVEANAPEYVEAIELAASRRNSQTRDLRVLPLGDSITYGQGGSPDGVGYRGRLWSELQDDTSSLDFVGSLDSGHGSIPDTDHEGHRGWRISQIDTLAAECAVNRYRPNVVVLHIGTNDLANDEGVDTAHLRLGRLVRGIAGISPLTMVIISSLVPSKDERDNANIAMYNSRLPTLVDILRTEGRRVRLVSNGELGVTLADMYDTLHPNNTGYRKMADAYHAEIRSAIAAGEIAPAMPGDNRVCAPDAGNPTPGNPSNAVMDGWDRFDGWGGMIAAGVPGGTRQALRFADMDGDGRDDYLMADSAGRVSAWGNALPSPRWTEMGEVAAGVPGGTREGLRFADLNGDGRDDYLMVHPLGMVRAWGNALPSKRWTDWGEVAAGVPGATREDVRFADIDGDGADDYLVVSPQGQVRAWINNLPSPTWTEWGVVASGVGATRDEVRFADINGDSRDDYLVVNENGRVRAWLNNITRPGVESWLALGEIATGVGVSRSDVEFADVDGDGGADYLAVNSSAQVWAWLGRRFAGQRWDSQGMIAAGVPGGTLAALRFADLDGDRRTDYLQVDPQGRVSAWINNLPSPRWIEWGQVAAGVPGGTREEVRFADMNCDGRDDYLLVNPQGRVRAWINVLPTKTWTEWGEVAAGVSGGTRENLRFADVNGDGCDDYLMVGPQGQVRAWGNVLPNRTWTELGEIAAGIGLHNSTITFADIDGDGRDDYLSVNDRGRIWGWRNTGSSTWPLQGEITTGLRAPSRDQVFLGDVNGDRRLDYLVSDSAGAVTAWHGNGQIRKS